MYMDDSMQFDVCSVSNSLPDTPPFHVELSHGRVGGSTPIWAVGHPSGREKLSREKRRRERSVSNGFLFLQIVYFRREVTLINDRTAVTYVTYESWLNPLSSPLLLSTHLSLLYLTGPQAGHGLQSNFDREFSKELRVERELPSADDMSSAITGRE